MRTLNSILWTTSIISLLQYPPLCLSFQLSVPLIGPIPLSRPLLIGSEMTLNPPTPFQWRSLEESAIMHLKGNRKNITMEEKEDAAATIEAAPMIAVIDEISGKGSTTIRSTDTGRYATLAAVVGVRCSSEDLDECSIEYLLEEDEDALSLPLSGRVRLIGIGRARIKKVFYKVASAPPKEDKENYIDDDDEDEEEDYGYQYEDKTPLVMAEFELLQDDGVMSTIKPDSIGDKSISGSQKCSPVHALNELHRVSMRIGWIHDDRRKLVSGLRAARVRLDNAKYRREEELEDHDGLGMVSGWGEDDDFIMEEEMEMEGVMNQEDIVSIFPELKSKRTEAKDGKQNEEVQIEMNTSLSTDPTTLLSQMENFGLDHHSSFSDLSDLTKRTLQIMKPYYSDALRDEELYHYEMCSFVAWKALEGYCTPEQMAWALSCTSSVERMQMAYNVMMEHRTVLEDLSKEVSKALTDCGEECTDLW